MIHGWRHYVVSGPNGLSLGNPLYLKGRWGVLWEKSIAQAECITTHPGIHDAFTTLHPKEEYNKRRHRILEDSHTFAAKPEDWRYVAALEAEAHLTNPHMDNWCGNCGIYVIKEPAYEEVVTSAYDVLTAVSAWGAYVEGENGYRCQYVKIERIFLQERQRDFYWQLAQTYYDTPIEIVPDYLCVLCREAHSQEAWPSSDGNMSLCQMTTAHIYNALNTVKKNFRSGAYRTRWKKILTEELERRKARKDPQSGKWKVRF